MNGEKTVVDQRLTLFEKLYSLSLKQEEAIDNVDFDTLATLIEEKQQIINEIDLLNVRDAIDKTPHSTELLRELQKKIKAMDDNNRGKLINMADVLNEKINMIKMEKRQIKALYMDIGDRGNYLDRRG
ncbi:MAG: hypothetical protein QME46_08445 [Thermoanaerobacteraceae bacterium]|nr:hypothetical protein [Thermoanaerobacteraceae bacterium]